MKLSVAIATYNGEKYLEEQLQSILTQTLSVQEIIICDDGSTDGTHTILEKFSMNYPELFKIYINEVSLGVIKNFEKAINLCSCDIIFLCDQDDIWFANKTQVIVSTFKEKTGIDAVFHNLVLYSNGKELKKTIWDSLNFTEEVRSLNSFDLIAYSLLVSNVLTGAASAIRNRKITFSKNNHILHDAQILIEYTLTDKLQIIDETLGYYRLHENQQVGTKLERNYFLEYKYNTFFRTKNLNDTNKLYRSALSMLKDIKYKTPSLITSEMCVKKWYSTQIKLHTQYFGLLKKIFSQLKWLYK